VAEGRASFPLERAYDPMILSALCAWRMGKGVYRFDPDLLDELWGTPVSGDIPGERANCQRRAIRPLPTSCASRRYAYRVGSRRNGDYLQNL
jgi:hypothetical protein